MITLNDARNVIAAAEKKASEIHQPMNIAAVDDGGNLIIRIDGVWIGSINVSINKSFISHAFEITTKELATFLARGAILRNPQMMVESRSLPEESHSTPPSIVFSFCAIYFIV
jgi:uncharacterized protein GlcG (DUF336 family)